MVLSFCSNYDLLIFMLVVRKAEVSNIDFKELIFQSLENEIAKSKINADNSDSCVSNNVADVDIDKIDLDITPYISKNDDKCSN